MEFLARSGILSFPLVVCLGCTVYTQCPYDTDDDDGSTGGMSSGGTPNGNGGDFTGGTGGSPPLPDEPWVNVTNNLTVLKAECGNLSIVVAKPDEDVVLAGIAANGIYKSLDDSEDWEPTGQGKGSAVITNRTHALLFDPEVPDTFWQSGNYSGAGIYRTTDNGETFEAVGSLTHLDTLSVDFSDSRRRTMLASGHENSLIYRSTDGGETWEDFTAALPQAANSCVAAYVVNATTYLVGCSVFGDKLGGIFRSDDEGGSWERVSEASSAFSMPRVAPNGDMYWPADNGGSIVKSTDQGRTWTEITPAGVVAGYPVILPDGRLASVAQDDSVVVSSDDGKTWRPVTSKAPFKPIGLAYAPFRKTFYVWHNDCGGSVLPDGVVAYDFDYETE